MATLLVRAMDEILGQGPMQGYAAADGDAGFAQSREFYAQAERWLAGEEAAGLQHAELEEHLQARGRELMRRLFQDHLGLVAVREERRGDVTGADGIARTRAEKGHPSAAAARRGSSSR